MKVLLETGPFAADVASQTYTVTTPAGPLLGTATTAGALDLGLIANAGDTFPLSVVAKGINGLSSAPATGTVTVIAAPAAPALPQLVAQVGK